MEGTDPGERHTPAGDGDGDRTARPDSGGEIFTPSLGNDGRPSVPCPEWRPSHAINAAWRPQRARDGNDGLSISWAEILDALTRVYRPSHDRIAPPSTARSPAMAGRDARQRIHGGHAAQPRDASPPAPAPLARHSGVTSSLTRSQEKRAPAQHRYCIT